MCLEQILRNRIRRGGLLNRLRQKVEKLREQGSLDVIPASRGI